MGWKDYNLKRSWRDGMNRIINNNNEDYQAALDYIYGFIDYSLKRNLRNAESKFKLDRMVRFMKLLGNPHENYPIIHVAGTKGKGSTCAFCASALQAEGYKVGLYTSPHLEEFTERIQVDRQEIDQNDVVRIVELMKPIIAQVPKITTFELTTAMGLYYFAEKKVDVAVIEVGLGGRLDATNIVDPLVSVITSISYDHTSVLGKTLAKIAFEKGGIIKPGKPVVISPQKPSARNQLINLANERISPVIEVGKDFYFKEGPHSLKGQTLTVSQIHENVDVSKGKEIIIEIPLLGYHQVINAATAYAALEIADQKGLKISDDAILKGFSNTFWPGRFEILRLDPPVVIDSAHNTDSALRLCQALDDYFPEIPVILVIGVSADKDIQGILKALVPRVNKVITSQSIHPRAMDANDLKKEVKFHTSNVEAIVPIEVAMKRALQDAGEKSLVLITGSVFVAAAGRAIWSNEVESSVKPSKSMV